MYNAIIMHTLSKLFGSTARLKMLRLFLFNKDYSYTTKEIIFRTKSTASNVRREIAILISSCIIRRQGNGKSVKYRLNKKYKYIDALTIFVRDTTIIEPRDILTLLRKAGALRLVVLTGLFSSVIESKIDMLVVGDKLNERILAAVIHTVESNLGREIRYATFSTSDFRYRLGVYDKLLRDVFDYPHSKILDKIGV